tara:strand:+ start:35 stop:451 length:417 start_codon:yes stop_codon:yes gene_type:complete
MSGIVGSVGSKSGVIGDQTNLKQYDLTVTGTGWNTTSAKAIPYKTSNGVWWFRGNIVGAFGSQGNNNVFALSISGISPIAYECVASHHQDGQTTNINAQAYFNSNGTFSVVWSGVVEYNSTWSFSFDARLSSKPTWAD